MIDRSYPVRIRPYVQCDRCHDWRRAGQSHRCYTALLDAAARGLVRGTFAGAIAGAVVLFAVLIAYRLTHGS